MVLLNVAVFAISGFLGLTFLLRTLHRLTVVRDEFPVTPPAPETPPAEAPPSPATKPPQGALDALDGRNVSRDVKTVFRLWIIIFGLVGAQMSWVLRPFIGGGRVFALFRPRGSNFFEAVFHHLSKLFGH
jgi:hypothetical protein